MSDCPNIYDTCMHAAAEQFIYRKSVPTHTRAPDLTKASSVLSLFSVYEPFVPQKAMQINSNITFLGASLARLRLRRIPFL